ncbi:MAG: FRG domain-containing protein [Firmicutes bacterium]|nr:FRG domain-containing protein [Bacillota bacterium]
MIKVIRIEKIEDLMPLLSEQDWREDIHRNRSSYVYRGMPNTEFKMVTTLRRCCKDLQKSLEPAILNNFAKYAVIEDPTIAQSIWRQMILGQHHSLPTRLLDWTHSALVALHFSVEEDNLDAMEDHDSMVWRIDMNEIHSLLPEPYQEVIRKNVSSVFSVDMLTEVTNSLDQYDADMGKDSMVVIEPPSIGPRIVNQYSFFSIIPTEMDDVEGFLDKNTENTVVYIIDRHLRWRVRDMLDQLNMSERIVYPGLDGLSKWIARHYFVK